MIKQTKRLSVQFRRFDPAFLKINLNKSDTLQKLPRNRFGKHTSWFGKFLTHNKPHFRRKITSSGSSHSLKKRRNSERSIYLESTFKSADIDSQFQSSSCNGCKKNVFVLHRSFCGFTVSRREVSVMNKKSVRLVISFTIRAESCCNSFCILLWN